LVLGNGRDIHIAKSLLKGNIPQLKPGTSHGRTPVQKKQCQERKYLIHNGKKLLLLNHFGYTGLLPAGNTAKLANTGWKLTNLPDRMTVQKVWFCAGFREKGIPKASAKISLLTYVTSDNGYWKYQNN
jgi:hypothetical protein